MANPIKILSQATAPWLAGMYPANFRDKDQMIREQIKLMLVRTTQMFKWTGLPQSLPAYLLEQMLQANGSCLIAHEKDNLYAFTGGLGGRPDEYYRGTEYVVANPGLDISRTYKIGEDAVFCRNDHMIIGLMPINRKYATLLVENELSLYMAEINSRLQFLFSGSRDADKLAADDLIRNLERGQLSSVAASDFLGGISIQPGAESVPATMQGLIEAEQFIKASWFNELGLDSNYNMKRESLTTTEAQMNSDALLPLVDDMLECRQELCEEVNEMFGTSISVDYASSWMDNQEQINADPAAEEASLEKEGNDEQAD